jgi:hypothetical protein
MARNFKELQAEMDPATCAHNQQLVRDELRRMALDELHDGQDTGTCIVFDPS